MIAGKKYPLSYVLWNQAVGSPYGRFRTWPRLKRYIKRLPLSLSSKLVGPFAYQPNSSLRSFEFPFAIHHLPKSPQTVVEVGGGLSGLQFAMAANGHSVFNVDPGFDAKGGLWSYKPEDHEKLCKLHKVNIKLIPTSLSRSGLGPKSVDVISCISVLEHLPPEEIESFCQSVRQLLRPGGLLILTVDLFLDIAPFTKEVANKWGINIDVREILEKCAVQLREGNPDELHGFETFNPQRILAQLDRYRLASNYPVLAQCCIATAPMERFQGE